MNSSTTRGMRWISSMNRIDPSSRFVRNGKRSAGLARAGPEVIWIDVPISCGRTVAKVVLPRPGGPSKRMWPSGSLSFLAALTAIFSFLTMACWPMTSRSHLGRKAASRRRSSSEGAADTIAWRGMVGLSQSAPGNDVAGQPVDKLVALRAAGREGLDYGFLLVNRGVNLEAIAIEEDRRRRVAD